MKILLLAQTVSLVSAHARWSCPEPRSPSTGIKNGPCGGDDINNFDPLLEDDGSVVEIKPGPLRVTFEESIHHTGAPFRISLSNDGSDDGACVLLDHIPHNDCCRPSLYDPTTYTPYAITIIIPNVVCERCSLHLSNPMTDKIRSDGSPSGIGCTDPGTCFSVYHSCTKPFRIAGNVDDGAVPRSEYQCPSYQSTNEDWPTSWMGDNGAIVEASTPGVYRRESSIWSTDDYTLTTVPDQYRKDTGGLCGDEAEVTSTSMNPTEAEPPQSTGESEQPTKAPSKAPVTVPMDVAVIAPEESTNTMEAPKQSIEETAPQPSSAVSSANSLPGTLLGVSAVAVMFA